MKYYIAYGSNLNLEQMSYRCPTARIVGKGYIRNYELVFRGREYNAVATVIPKKASKVPVLVWAIGRYDERALDRYEGYPTFYRKETIAVDLETHETILGMVYLLNKLERGIPSDRYIKIIREGYRDMNMDESYLDRAIEEAVG